MTYTRHINPITITITAISITAVVPTHFPIITTSTAFDEAIPTTFLTAIPTITNWTTANPIYSTMTNHIISYPTTVKYFV